MKSQQRLIITCFLASIVFRSTKGFPSDDHPHHREIEETQNMPNNDTRISSLSSRDDDHETDSSRWHYARMKDLDSTTLGYDEWWFLSTPNRPFISYRDFPGKPGVATWKEISPGSATDQRTSRKVENPTAEGVSSRANCNLQFKILHKIVLTILVISVIKYPHLRVIAI